MLRAMYHFIPSSQQIGDIERFMAAEVDTRRDIFNASGTEIRKMLDENLLKTFLANQTFLDTCKTLEEKSGKSLSTRFVGVHYPIDARDLLACHSLSSYFQH